MTGVTSRKLDGHVILITGAGGTLGRVAAFACAAEGATVILLDKNGKAIEGVYDEIIAAGHPMPALYPLDLVSASEEDFAHLSTRIGQEFGRLDGLLHTAAELGLLGPVADLTSAEMERSWRVNCSAPLQLTRALLTLLTRTGDAAIVFTSDSSARRGRAFWGAYGISKLAVEGCAQILGDELHGLGRIRVNIFVPGPFHSPLHFKAYPATNRESLPLAKSFEGCLVYLLGPDSLAVKGRVIDPSALAFSRIPEGENYVRP